MVQKQGRFMNVSRELRPSLRPNLQISSLQFALHIKPVQRVRSFLRRYLKGLPLRQGSHMFCSSITSMAGSTSDLVILVIHFNLDQKLNFSKIYAKRASCPNDIKKNPNEKQTKPTNPHKPKKPKIHKIQSQVIKLIIPLTTLLSQWGPEKPKMRKVLPNSQCNASVWAIQPNFQKSIGSDHTHIPATGQNFTVGQLHLQLSAFQLPGAKLEPLEHTS